MKNVISTVPRTLPHGDNTIISSYEIATFLTTLPQLLILQSKKIII